MRGRLALVLAAVGSWAASAAAGQLRQIGPLALGHGVELRGQLTDADYQPDAGALHAVLFRKRYVLSGAVGDRLVIRAVSPAVRRLTLWLEADQGDPPRRRQSARFAVSDCSDCGDEESFELASASPHVLAITGLSRGRFLVTVEHVAPPPDPDGPPPDVKPAARAKPVPLDVNPLAPLRPTRKVPPGAVGPLAPGQQVTLDFHLDASDWDPQRASYVKRLPFEGSQGARLRIRWKRADRAYAFLDEDVWSPTTTSWRETAPGDHAWERDQVMVADKPYSIALGVHQEDVQTDGLDRTFQVVVERVDPILCPGAALAAGPDLGELTPAGAVVDGALGQRDFDPARGQYARKLSFTVSTPTSLLISASSTQNALRSLEWRLGSGATARPIEVHGKQPPDLYELLPLAVTPQRYTLEVATRFGELPGAFQVCLRRTGAVPAPVVTAAPEPDAPGTIEPIARGHAVHFHGELGDADWWPTAPHYRKRYPLSAAAGDHLVIRVESPAVRAATWDLVADSGTRAHRARQTSLRIGDCHDCASQDAAEVAEAGSHVLWIEGDSRGPFQVRIEHTVPADPRAPPAKRAPRAPATRAPEPPPIPSVAIEAHALKPLRPARVVPPGAIGPLRPGQKRTLRFAFTDADWQASEQRYHKRVPLEGSQGARLTLRWRSARSLLVYLGEDATSRGGTTLNGGGMNQERANDPTLKDWDQELVITSARPYYIETTFTPTAHSPAPPPAFEVVIERRPAPPACGASQATRETGSDLGELPTTPLLFEHLLGPRDLLRQRGQYSKWLHFKLSEPARVALTATSPDNALRSLVWTLAVGARSAVLPVGGDSTADLHRFQLPRLPAGAYDLEVASRFGELPGGFAMCLAREPPRKGER